jgi:hypothetical protein
MASSSTYYHYQDAQGVEVIVQRLEDVPIKYRAQAKRLDLGKDSAPALPKEDRSEPPVFVSAPAPPKEFWSGIHWPSVALGAAISMAAGMVFVVLLRRRSRILALLIGMVAMMAAGVGYLTLLRRHLGLGNAGLATPATIMDDARAAATTAQKRYDQQEKTLDQINNLR